MIKMVKPRVVETTEGIQDEYNVQMYDQMMRRMRDKGWLETKLILNTGIMQGLALEVGPGPGYLGLEWLQHTDGTNLRGLDISPEMIAIAERNAEEYGFENRVEYAKGKAQEMPFDDNMFDSVFTNGSLHEWPEPKRVFSEIYRVLKPAGKFCITDLRRDMNLLVKWFMKAVTKPKEIRSGLISSINAAYTVEEIQPILVASNLEGYTAKRQMMGLLITGQKARE